MGSKFAETVFVRQAMRAMRKFFPAFRDWERRSTLARMEQLIAQRPIHVNLELNTACNAKCTFCAYPKVKREYSNLSMDLFKKISADFAGIGGGLLGLSALISDPLLDPHLLERILYLDQNYPNIIVPHVFTNGIRITFYSDDDLALMLEKLDYMNISIGGLNREDYHKMFGVDMFERVWTSLERMSRIRRERGLKAKLFLHVRTQHTQDEIRKDPRFAQVRDMGFVCEDVLNVFSDWGGIVKQEHLPEGATMSPVDNSQAEVPCLIPMTYLSVLPDGRCNACCCMDTSDDFIMGDLNQHTITQVWQNEAYKKFRASFRPGAVHRLCQNCSYYVPYSTHLSEPKFKSYQPWNSIWAN